MDSSKNRIHEIIEIMMKKSQVILVENIYWKNVHSRPTLTKKNVQVWAKTIKVNKY